MSQSDTHCTYCDETDELRPYAKGNRPICFQCASSPDHLDEAQETFGQMYSEMLKQQDGDHILVIGPDGMELVRYGDIAHLLDRITNESGDANAGEPSGLGGENHPNG